MKISRGKIYKILHSRNQTKKKNPKKHLGKRKHRKPRTYNKKKRKHLRYKSLKNKQKRGGARLRKSADPDNKEYSKKIDDKYGKLWENALKDYLDELQKPEFREADVGSREQNTIFYSALKKIEDFKSTAASKSMMRGLFDAVAGTSKTTSAKEIIISEVDNFIERESEIYKHQGDLMGLGEKNAANITRMENALNNNLKEDNEYYRNIKSGFKLLKLGVGIEAVFDLEVLKLENALQEKLDELRDVVNEYRLHKTSDNFENVKKNISETSSLFTNLTKIAALFGATVDALDKPYNTIMSLQMQIMYIPETDFSGHTVGTRKVSYLENVSKEIQAAINSLKTKYGEILTGGGLDDRIEGDTIDKITKRDNLVDSGQNNLSVEYEKFETTLPKNVISKQEKDIKTNTTSNPVDESSGVELGEPGSSIEMSDLSTPKLVPSSEDLSGATDASATDDTSKTVEEPSSGDSVDPAIKATGDRLGLRTDETQAVDSPTQKVKCTKNTWNEIIEDAKGGNNKVVGLCDPAFVKSRTHHSMKNIIENPDYNKVIMKGDGNCGWYAVAFWIHKNKDNEKWLKSLDLSGVPQTFISSIRDNDREKPGTENQSFEKTIVDQMRLWVRTERQNDIESSTIYDEKRKTKELAKLTDQYLTGEDLIYFARLLKTTICVYETAPHKLWRYISDDNKALGIKIPQSADNSYPEPIMLLHTGGPDHYDYLGSSSSVDDSSQKNGAIYNLFKDKDTFENFKNMELIRGTGKVVAEAAAKEAALKQHKKAQEEWEKENCKSLGECDKDKGFINYFDKLGIKAPTSTEWKKEIVAEATAAKNKLLEGKDQTSPEAKCILEAYLTLTNKENYRNYMLHYAMCGGNLSVEEPSIAATAPGVTKPEAADTESSPEPKVAPPAPPVQEVAPGSGSDDVHHPKSLHSADADVHHETHAKSPDGSLTTTHARINEDGQLEVTIRAVLPKGSLLDVTGPSGSSTEAVLKGVVDHINSKGAKATAAASSADPLPVDEFADEDDLPKGLETKVPKESSTDEPDCGPGTKLGKDKCEKIKGCHYTKDEECLPLSHPIAIAENKKEHQKKGKQLAKDAALRAAVATRKVSNASVKEKLIPNKFPDEKCKKDEDCPENRECDQKTKECVVKEGEGYKPPVLPQPKPNPKPKPDAFLPRHAAEAAKKRAKAKEGAPVRNPNAPTAAKIGGKRRETKKRKKNKRNKHKKQTRRKN